MIAEFTSWVLELRGYGRDSVDASLLRGNARYSPKMKSLNLPRNLDLGHSLLKRIHQVQQEVAQDQVMKKLSNAETGHQHTQDRALGHFHKSNTLDFCITCSHTTPHHLPNKMLSDHPSMTFSPQHSPRSSSSLLPHQPAVPCPKNQPQSTTPFSTNPAPAPK